MSDRQVVIVECCGSLQRIPVENAYISIDKFKNILCKRLNIDYPFKLTYQGADLSNDDTLHDLALHPSHPVRIRRCSIDNSYSYTTSTDSITDVFLSYEQSLRNIVMEIKQKLEDKNYFCWMDVEQISGNSNQFCSAIEKGIQKSTVFVCLMTSKYIRSNKCQRELSFAKQHNKRIILLLMEELNWPPTQIEALVSDLSYIEFFNTTSSHSSTAGPSEKFDEFLNQLADLAPQI